jgi:5-methylcytosine-specific restriction endonuclease McrA
MAQTHDGAMKIAAKRAGIPVVDFLALLASGMKRCVRCKTWKSISGFGNDSTRFDGRDCSCFGCRRVKVRKSTKGRVSTFKGRHHTAEAKAMIGAKRKGKPGPNKGVPRSEEVKKKISIGTRANTPRGPSHPSYIHGRSQELYDERRTPEYRDWRAAVFKRDKYTCQKCGDASGGNLRAHHIKGYAAHPALRLDVGNGVTHCHKCHELEHYKPDSIRNLRKAKRGKTLY